MESCMTAYRPSDWSSKFIAELSRELETRCNHGVVVFKNSYYPNRPEYSITVRGKTVWLEFKVWDGSKKHYCAEELLQTMDKLLTAFYVHIFIENDHFQGVWISREIERPAFWGGMGEAVRYLTTFFDLDTTDLDY
jgi:hypothetical protein